MLVNTPPSCNDDKLVAELFQILQEEEKSLQIGSSSPALVLIYKHTSDQSEHAIFSLNIAQLQWQIHELFLLTYRRHLDNLIVPETYQLAWKFLQDCFNG